MRAGPAPAACSFLSFLFTPVKTIDPSSRLSRLASTALPAAPLALAAVHSANAAIIYTNPADITINSTGSIVFYIGTGVLTDTAIFVGPGDARRLPGYSFYMGFWDRNSQGSDAPYVWTPTYQRTFKRVVADAILPEGNARAALLTPGAMISPSLGPGLSFATSSDYTFLNRNDITGSSWTPGTTGYLGLELNSGANFGWVQISYNADKTLTVYDFAYESSGGSILAGAGAAAVPEPTTTAALAGLLAGSAALFAKRRQQKMAA